MQYLYAALILHKSDKDVTVDAVTSILEAAGVDVDESRVKTIVAALGEIDIDEAIASASMMAVAAPAAGAGASGAADAAPVEEEEVEEEEEEGEEIEDDGLGALFG